MRIIALSQSLPEALWHLYSQIQRRTLPIVNDGQAGSYRFVRRIGTKKCAIILRHATSEIKGGWST